MTAVYRQANISPCGTYRHRLYHRWGDRSRVCGFIMLNPSTADDVEDDPTVRRCRGFAEREGCNGMVIVNLYQLRATDPRELLRHPDPVGPGADQEIATVAQMCSGPLIAAWGTKGGQRALQVAREWRGVLKCLGVTKDGHPKHPLYLAADAPLIDFESLL